MANVHVRYARWNLRRVALVDPQGGSVLCAVRPLDKAANSREELLACLNHLLAGAGNASLMTPGLRQTLCDHAAGNCRILMTLAGEMLTVAAGRDLGVLDEKLYLNLFAQPDTKPQRRAAAR